HAAPKPNKTQTWPEPQSPSVAQKLEQLFTHTSPGPSCAGHPEADPGAQKASGQEGSHAAPRASQEVPLQAGTVVVVVVVVVVTTTPPIAALQLSMAVMTSASFAHGVPGPALSPLVASSAPTPVPPVAMLPELNRLLACHQR